MGIWTVSVSGNSDAERIILLEDSLYHFVSFKANHVVLKLRLNNPVWIGHKIEARSDIECEKRIECDLSESR
jgi:hypothetical protein